MGLFAGRRPCGTEEMSIARRATPSCSGVYLLRVTQALAFPLCIALSAEAQDRSGEEVILELAPIVVTATRVEESSFDVPGSIDALDSRAIQEGQARVNLSEPLARVPGVVVQNRQNYAQDLQISTRGFGARSTFGVRGVRLIADDIPATMPDGQGQAATFNLDSAKRIEVLRGPFSALYGNSSGGVIQIFTEDGPRRPTLSADLLTGSYDTQKYSLKIGGTAGDFNFLVGGSRFESDGYREHSAVTRGHFNAKLHYRINDKARLSLVLNSLRQPDTQDPLGLPRTSTDGRDFETNPRSVVAQAETFNTRKSIENDQAGLVYEQRFRDNDSLKLVGYFGTRQVVQYLAITKGAQSPATNSGGVVDLDREFSGVHARYTMKTLVAALPFTLTGGVDYDRMQERRRGFNNFVTVNGIDELGVQGALRRDEDDTVYNFDQYLQAEWLPTERWRIFAGVRHSEVKFKSEDFFTATGNPDDSGSLKYRHTSPVLGALYSITPKLNVYANYGQGFETPTFAELAYRSDGTSGLNFGLKPSKSNHYELGLKTLLGDRTRLNFALFTIKTKDEIVPELTQGGRATFQNASETSRRGLELGAETALGAGFSALLSYTYLNAEFAREFTSRAIVQGNTVGSTVPAGNKIPGVPSTTVYGELGWRHKRFNAALELRYSDKVFVNDANSDNAPSYAVANLRVGLNHRFGALRLAEFVRIDNLFDKKYAGSVIVNEGNSRFFEPAAERNYSLGITGSYEF